MDLRRRRDQAVGVADLYVAQCHIAVDRAVDGADLHLQAAFQRDTIEDVDQQAAARISIDAEAGDDGKGDQAGARAGRIEADLVPADFRPLDPVEVALCVQRRRGVAQTHR